MFLGLLMPPENVLVIIAEVIGFNLAFHSLLLLLAQLRPSVMPITGVVRSEWLGILF